MLISRRGHGRGRSDPRARFRVEGGGVGRGRRQGAGVGGAVQGAVDVLDREVRVGPDDGFEHADQRGQADAAADKDDRAFRVFRQEELARRRGHLQDRARLHRVVQPVGDEAARLPLDRDAVCVVVGRAGDAVVPLQRMMAGEIQPEGQVLAGTVAQHRAAILGPQDEGGDDVAFPLLALDDEVAPSGPAAGGGAVSS